MRRRVVTARKGAALLTVIVLLAVMAVVMSSLVWQSVNQRRLLMQRERQLQAEWLARGGVEHVRALIAAGKEPAVKTWQPIPEGDVRIDVEGKDGSYRVRSEATYPVDDPRPVSRVYEATIGK